MLTEIIFITHTAVFGRVSVFSDQPCSMVNRLWWKKPKGGHFYVSHFHETAA